MPKLNGKVPSYRFHKNSRQSIVTLDGQAFYLGTFQSEESKREYDRLIQEWLVGGRRLIKSVEAESTVTINDIAAGYDEWAEGYYRKPDGTPTQEIITLSQALKQVILLYGDMPAKSFGPIALKAVREKMIEKDWCRSHINKQISRIKSMFRWAAEQEWVAGSLHHALLTVRGLKQGRCEAREWIEEISVLWRDNSQHRIHTIPKATEGSRLTRQSDRCMRRTRSPVRRTHRPGRLEAVKSILVEC